MRILAFLGETVPKQQTPGKFVRFMYNRLILENALVRAAAADALTKVGLKIPALRSDIATLLECGKNDNDDEVRDRINLYKASLLQQENPQDPDFGLVVAPLTEFSVDALYELCEKQMAHAELRSRPIDVSNLPTPEAYAAFKEKQVQEQRQQQQAALQGSGIMPGGGPSEPGSMEIGGPAPGSAAASKPSSSPTEMLAKVAPLFGGNAGALGEFLSCTRATPVTELEAEYSVQLIRHIFPKHIVLEFYITNTLEGVELGEAEVKVSPPPEKFRVVGMVKCDKVVKFNANESTYVVLEKMEDGLCTASMPAKLCYNQLEDGDDIGFPDETVLENADVLPGHYVSPTPLPQGQVRPLFEQLKAAGSATVKLQLEFQTIEKAVEGVSHSMGMEPCDKTNVVDGSRKDNQGRILMQLTVACKSKDVADCVAGFLRR
eukprot:g8290.t1